MGPNIFMTDIRGGTNEDTGISLTPGTVKWFEPAKLPPRRSRVLNAWEQTLALTFSRVASSAPQATGTVELGGQEFEQSTLNVMSGLSQADIETVLDFNEASVIAYLKSWTLRRIVDGVEQPEPVPATRDALLDLPPATYEDLLAGVAKIIQANRQYQAGFTAEAAGDATSPTVASVL